MEHRRGHRLRVRTSLRLQRNVRCGSDPADIGGMMARRKVDSVVSAFLENISGTVLERYPRIIRALIQGRSGVYALYKGEKLYYIGLAGNLRGRVKTHLKDRHARRWDRF